MKKQSKLLTTVAKVTGLAERLTNSVATLQTNLWEAIGDLRKNVGDLRLATTKTVTEIRDEMTRAWSLAESRNAVMRKEFEQWNVSAQRFNERLSKLEGEPKATAAFQHLTGMNGRLEVLEGSKNMLGECVVSLNIRLNEIERRADHTDERLPLFTTSHLLKDGGVLEITTTLPDGKGEQVSAKVYTRDEYRAHVNLLSQVTYQAQNNSTKLSAQDVAHIANGRGAAVDTPIEIFKGKPL